MTLKRHTREELQALAHNELVDDTMGREERLTQDSSNSSKPPSQDDAPGREKRTKKRRKNTSLRKSGERKGGAQPGHRGATLQPREQADGEVDLRLEQCPHCQEELHEENLTGGRARRQVLDLPEPQPLECTQYNALE